LGESVVVLYLTAHWSRCVIVTSPESPRRNARQVVVLATQVGVDVVPEDRDTEGRRELMANLPINAEEPGICRRVDKEPLRRTRLTIFLL